MTGDNATVHIVDDDPSVLKAIARLLRAAGLRTATYGSADEFLAAHRATSAGCLVLDVAMPGIDGLALQQRLVADGCFLPVVFLTGHGDIPQSVRAMRSGAVDFLTKPVDDAALLGAVGAALERDRLTRVSNTEMADIRRRLATLTPRERQVLAGVAVGKQNKQIASELGVVEKTIKVHRAHVMEKMGARSLAALVRMVERAR